MRSLRLLPPVCALVLSPAFAQSGPSGHWEGNLQLPGREVQIALDLAKDDKGAWIGTFSSPAQNIKDVPLAELKVDAKSAKFQLASAPNAPGFDCALEAEASMKCGVSGPGGVVSAQMKRTGEAKVELPKADPAVSKQLEGNWEGTIDTPNGTLRIVVHFKNQPENTVKATMDSPDQGAADLPLTDVVQKASAVEFQLRMVNGAYKGALNKEGTQMTGDWSQGGGSLPLTLKKE